MKYVYLDQKEFYSNSQVKDTENVNTYDLGKTYYLLHYRL